LLVEEEAPERAEAECLDDADARARRREREEERRAEMDVQFVAQFAARIRELFPGCPQERPERIASHACQKYSGRVGRSAAAKRLDEEAVRLAVVAHVRHDETKYDALLVRGIERRDARDRVREDVDRVLSRWRNARDGSSNSELPQRRIPSSRQSSPHAHRPDVALADERAPMQRIRVEPFDQ
jgi:hypothetical protein